jgi:hypothetical protein
MDGSIERWLDRLSCAAALCFATVCWLRLVVLVLLMWSLACFRYTMRWIDPRVPQLHEWSAPAAYLPSLYKWLTCPFSSLLVQIADLLLLCVRACAGYKFCAPACDKPGKWPVGTHCPTPPKSLNTTLPPYCIFENNGETATADSSHSHCTMRSYTTLSVTLDPFG